MLDLPAARLNVQGTAARKGVPKEAPGSANVQERFSRCKTKSSFQPRSTTAAGRYLGGSRLGPSGMPGRWYCTRSYLPGSNTSGPLLTQPSAPSTSFM